MKRRMRIMLICFFCVAVAGLYVFTRPQLSYKGRSLSSWLEQLDCTYPVGDYDPGRSWQAQMSSEGAEAAEAIRQMGTNAVPSLLQWLENTNQDGRVRIELGAILHRLSAGRIDLPRIADQRRRAALGLAALGPMAKPGIPALTRTINDEKLSAQGCTALASIGPEGWVVLTRALDNSNVFSVHNALNSLGSYHAAVPGTTEAIIAIATNSSHGLSLNAIGALGCIGQDERHVIPILLTCLGSANSQVRSCAAWGIGWFGSRASNAAPILSELLSDPNPTVQMCASNALQRIKTGNPVR